MTTYYSGLKPRSSGLAKYFWHFIFSVIIIFLVTSSLSAYLKNARLENYIKTLNSEIALINNGNVSLERQVYAISTDPVYREAVIRKEFKLGLPGEMIILPR